MVKAILSFTDDTCDTTNTDATITMDDTSKLAAGMSVSGAGVLALATVSSITNSTTFEMSSAADATASNQTFTFSRGAKVNTEVTGTFTFNNDDVRAVYIDWGDGTDPEGNFTNKKEYANYQWVTSTQPTGSVTANHIYTATGTFHPVVQVVNSKGFFSFYTSSGATNDDLSPYERTYAGTTSEDRSTIFPQFDSQDTTATGVLRVENKTIKSGIDNSIFNVEGPKDLFVMVAPTLSTTELAYFCETGAATTGKVEIDVKCILEYGTRDGTGSTVQTDTGGERVIATLPLILSGTHLTGSVTGLRNVLASGGAVPSSGILASGAQVSEIVEVKYKNPKYLGSDTEAYTQNEVYNRFKVFFLAYSNNLGKYVPITYITPGDPIKKANDPLRNITLDFSQSRAKASNVSLASYRYDIGKSWFQSANTWGTGSGTFPATDIFSDATSGTSVTKTGAYTYMPRPDGMLGSATYTLFSTAATSAWDTNAASATIENQTPLDDYGRFYSQYHLTRMSTEPSSSANYVSSITTNKPEVFRITPAVSWAVEGSDGTTAASAANAAIYPTKITDSGTNQAYSKEYTNEAFNNVSGTSGLVNLSGMNSMTFYDVKKNDRTASEYLLLMFDKKTNKIFLNMSTYADNIQSDLSSDPAWGIAGVYYLALHNKDTPTQNAYWSPLEFNDTTKVTKEYRNTAGNTYTSRKASLSKSGYISFDMPQDWGNINLSGACGGAFNTTTIPTAATSFDYAAAGSGLATGSTGSAVDGTIIGDYIPFTMTTNPISSLATDSDIGSFKYMFIRVDDGTPVVSGAYWISKDGADGYDSGSDIIYLHLGNKTNTDGDGITKGYIKRVNVYDILDGFSKVFRQSGAAAENDTQLYTVGNDSTPTSSPGDGWATPWNNTYNINTSNTIGPLINTSWTDEKYLLKIVLSGTDVASINTFPEVWNIFDANEGYEGIIKEEDNSAYNLNSLPITSDISVTRAGAYYTAITRKGKVFISRTGDVIQNIGFSSIALGDSSTSDPFDDNGPSSLYGQLRKIRGLHANVVRVYWDEIQKDGTYVRYWGIITNVEETHGLGGPRAIINYNFSITVEEIALLDVNGILITDVFPLGGLDDGRSFT